MKDLKHASARGVAWNLVQNVISRILALVVVAILSRILARADFGGVALALTIVTFVELFVNQGYGEFITQTPKLEKEHLDTAFWFNVGIGALLTGVIAISATPLAAELDEPSVAPVIQWLALSLLIRSFGVVPQALLTRNLQFRTLSTRMIAAAMAGGSAGITAAVADMGVYSLVIQFLVGDVIAVAVLWRATDWRPGRRISVASLQQLSAFGTPIIAAAVLAFLSRRLDPLIVGGVLGLAQLGVYSMAQRMFQITVQVVNKSTTEVAFAALSRLADSEERRRRAFYRVIELTAVLCFPTYVGLAVVALPLTVTLFGAHWADSAPALELFALSGVPFSLSLVHLAGIKSAAKTRYLFWINLTMLVVYLPLMLVLVHRGLAPAAGVSLITSIVIIPVEIMLLRAALSLNVGEYASALVGGGIATAVMAGATLSLRLVGSTAWHPVVELVVTIAGGAIVYVAALRVLAPATFRRCRELATSTLRKSPAS